MAAVKENISSRKIMLQTTNRISFRSVTKLKAGIKKNKIKKYNEQSFTIAYLKKVDNNNKEMNLKYSKYHCYT
jgi:hypothetical protein